MVVDPRLKVSFLSEVLVDLLKHIMKNEIINNLNVFKFINSVNNYKLW